MGPPFRVLLVRANSTLNGVRQEMRRVMYGSISGPGSPINEPYASIPTVSAMVSFSASIVGHTALRAKFYSQRTRGEHNRRSLSEH